jgi:P-type E1-E2 ATPase
VARPGAAAAVAAMRARGLRTVLLTGDTRDEASRVAQELGLDEVHAEVLPADKAGVIARLRDAGRKVAMVGDGINDAPALAAAHVGVAMGSGTDVAIEAADVALQASDLGALVAAIDTARGTLRNVQQNLVAAFGYNVLVIPVAMLGLLQPALAGAAMALSSVTVVTNARRVGSLGPGR